MSSFQRVGNHPNLHGDVNTSALLHLHHNGLASDAFETLLFNLDAVFGLESLLQMNRVRQRPSNGYAFPTYPGWLTSLGHRLSWLQRSP